MSAIIVNLASQILLPIIGSALLTLVGYGAKLAKDYIGIVVEQKAKDDLHSAMMTGVQAALADYAKDGDIDDWPAIYGPVLDYVRESVPGALSTLQPSEGLLVQMAKSKITEALRGGV